MPCNVPLPGLDEDMVEILPPPVVSMGKLARSFRSRCNFLKNLIGLKDSLSIQGGDREVIDLSDSSSDEDEVVGAVLETPSASRVLEVSEEDESDEDDPPLPSVSAPVTRSSTKAARSSSAKKTAKTRKSLVVLPSLYHIHVEDPISHSESDRDTTIFPVQPVKTRGRGRGRARGRAIPQTRDKGKKKASSPPIISDQALSLDEMRSFVPRLDALQVQNVERSLSAMRHVRSYPLLPRYLSYYYSFLANRILY
jgi:hypothetical protein